MLRHYLLILMLVLLSACDSSVNREDKPVVDVGSADGCDAAEQVCRVAHSGIELQMELEKNLRPLQPFQLQLQIAGIQQQMIEEVVVDFFMEGMDMGINHYRLLRGTNGWQGEITLPICVPGRKDWRAEVEVIDNKQRYRALFRFHSSG